MMKRVWDYFRGPKVERDDSVPPVTQAARAVGPKPVAVIMLAFCLFWAGIPARMLWPIAQYSGGVGLFGEVLLALFFAYVLLCLMNGLANLFDGPWANAKRMIDEM